jgi:hypothetical protein
MQGSPSDTISGEDGSSTSCSDGAAAGSLSFSDGPALLQKIDEREEAVQQVRWPAGQTGQSIA